MVDACSVGTAKAKPLVGGLWKDKNSNDGGQSTTTGGENGNNLISLDEFFANAKKPQVELHSTRSDDSSKENIVTADTNNNNTPMAIHSRGLTSRSLVGGTFTIPSPSEDDLSLSSAGTSLMGAGYLEGDQSVSTRHSNSSSEGGDRSSKRTQADHESVSLLGETPLNRSIFSHDHDDAGSNASELSSVFTYGDAYFKRNPILPPSLFANDGSMDHSPSQSEDEAAPFPARSSSSNLQHHHIGVGPPDILSNIMDSSDTDIFEDRTHDSSSVGTGFFGDEEASMSTVDDYINNTTTDNNADYISPQLSPQVSWTTYNQERGRELAQRLISQFRDPNDYDDDGSPSSHDERESPIPKRKLQFLQHPNNYLRRKQLQKDFHVVDATVKDNNMFPSPARAPSDSESSSYADSEHSSSSGTSSGIRFPKLPSNDSLYELAREGRLDDFDDKYQGDPYFDVWDADSFPSYLPPGLKMRRSAEEVAFELKIANSMDTDYKSALKDLRSLQPKSAGLTTNKDGVPMVTIQGTKVPNYQAYVKLSVDKYRREVLKVSDGVYWAMLQDGDDDTTTPEGGT